MEINDDTPVLIALDLISKETFVRSLYAPVIKNFFWPNDFCILPAKKAENAISQMELSGAYAPSEEEYHYVYDGDHFFDKTGANPVIFKNFIASGRLPTEPIEIEALENYVEADRGWLSDLEMLAGIMSAEMTACVNGQREFAETAWSCGLINLHCQDMLRGFRNQTRAGIDDFFISKGYASGRIFHFATKTCLDMTVKEAKILADITDRTFDSFKYAIIMTLDAHLDQFTIWPYTAEAYRDRVSLRNKYELEYTKESEVMPGLYFSAYRLPLKLRQQTFPLGTVTPQQAQEYRAAMAKYTKELGDSCDYTKLPPRMPEHMG